MDNLRKKIINDYYELISQIKSGNQPDLKDILTEILLENNKKDDYLFLENILINTPNGLDVQN